MAESEISEEVLNDPMATKSIPSRPASGEARQEGKRLEESFFTQVRGVVEEEYYKSIKELLSPHLSSPIEERETDPQVRERAESWVEHMDADWTIAQNLVKQLEDQGTALSLEEKEDLRLACYLHDSAKLRPYKTINQMLIEHPEESAAFAQELLDKHKDALGEGRIARICQIIREHGEMPFTSAVLNNVNRELLKDNPPDLIAYPPSADEALHGYDEEEAENQMSYKFPRPSTTVSAILHAADNISMGALINGGAEKIAIEIRCDDAHRKDYEQDMALVKESGNGISTRLEAALINVGLRNNLEYLKTQPSENRQVKGLQAQLAEFGENYARETDSFRQWIKKSWPPEDPDGEKRGFEYLQVMANAQANQKGIDKAQTKARFRQALEAFKRERAEQGQWVS